MALPGAANRIAAGAGGVWVLSQDAQTVTRVDPQAMQVVGTPIPLDFGPWTLTTTDATANLQAAGVTGLVTYLSGSATNTPIALSVDNYVVTKP